MTILHRGMARLSWRGWLTIRENYHRSVWCGVSSGTSTIVHRGMARLSWRGWLTIRENYHKSVWCGVSSGTSTIPPCQQLMSRVDIFHECSPELVQTVIRSDAETAAESGAIWCNHSRSWTPHNADSTTTAVQTQGLRRARSPVSGGR